MSTAVPTFSLRAKIGGLTRDRAADDPELLDAKRDLAELNIRNYIAKVLSKAPPLSDEQRARIAGLFQVGDQP